MEKEKGCCQAYRDVYTKYHLCCFFDLNISFIYTYTVLNHRNVTDHLLRPSPSHFFGLYNSDRPFLHQFHSDTPCRLNNLPNNPTSTPLCKPKWLFPIPLLISTPNSTFWQVRKMECPIEAKEPNQWHQCTDRISFDTCHLLLSVVNY